MAGSQGIRIGNSAPGFALDNAKGECVQLGDFRGKQHVVMYFMRAFV
jgi:peroxiredoxin